MSSLHRTRLGIVAVAAVGIAVSAYLTWVHYSGSLALCVGVGGCETVQASSYSQVLGVPVALLGLAAYATIFATSLSRHELAGAVAISVALAGVGFAAYLLYVQLAVINAVCEWCLASDAVVTVLAVLTLLRLRAAD